MTINFIKADAPTHMRISLCPSLNSLLLFSATSNQSNNEAHRTKLLTYIFLEDRAVVIIATSLCSKQPVGVEKNIFRWEDFTFYRDIMSQSGLHANDQLEASFSHSPSCSLVSTGNQPGTGSLWCGRRWWVRYLTIMVL